MYFCQFQDVSEIGQNALWDMKQWHRFWDLFERLDIFINDKKIELTFEKLSALTMDGAPAVVGMQKGASYICQERTELSWS